MTATAVQTNAVLEPMSESTGIPARLSFPLKANEQIGKLQFVLIDPATGNAFLADDATPHMISGGFGFPDELSATSTIAGQAIARVDQRWAVHGSPSTGVGDGFDQTDVATPFYIADGNTPGKLSNSGGKDRSLGGLVIGVAQPGQNDIRIWTGPIAQLLARAALVVNAASGAKYQIADAAAGTVTTEVAIDRNAWHGLVTGVTYTGDAVAADNGNYVTVTISKRDGAGGAAVVIATYDSRAANQGAATQHIPMAFALSAVAGALNLLETDIVTITATKTGAGQALRGTIRLAEKVI